MSVHREYFGKNLGYFNYGDHFNKFRCTQQANPLSKSTMETLGKVVNKFKGNNKTPERRQ